MTPAEKTAAWRLANPGATKRHNQIQNDRRKTDPVYREQLNAQRRRKVALMFADILDHYGASCSCCGETELCFLTIEHLNGDGADHRRMCGNARMAMLRDIIKRGYPDDFAVRCYNCNMGRERNGKVCPHVSQP